MNFFQSATVRSDERGQLAQLENKFQGKKFVYGGLLQNFRGFTNEPSSKLNFAIRSFFRFNELLTASKENNMTSISF